MKLGRFKMKLSIQGLDKVQINLGNYVKFNNTAVSQAMNSVATVSMNRSLRHVKNDNTWNISIADLKKVSTPRKSTVRTLNYIFTMQSKSIPLIFFKGTEYASKTTATGKARTGGAGVKYKLKGKGRKKTLGKSFVKPSLFNGNRLEVFTRRKSPNGASITQQSSITPSSMFKQQGADFFMRDFKANFQKRYYNRLKQLGIRG